MLLSSIPMDLTNSTVKTPEPESQTPTRVAPPAYTNGVLKRHAPLSLHPPVVVSYKECLKNHAATLGGHALDGCGEFMPSPGSNPTDPTSLKCAACGCHRNFHRREPEDPLGLPALEYRPAHQHHRSNNSPNHSPSPPPISSSYYPSAPHVLLALGHVPPDGIGIGNPQIGNPNPNPFSNSGGRKRFRTKFTQNQKERMLEFADRIQWKMQKRDEDLINQFCGEIGVDRGVFKVWMHNNKNTFGKKDSLSSPVPPPPAIDGNGMSYSGISAAADRREEDEEEEEEEDCEEKEEEVGEGQQQLIQNHHVMVGNGSG